MSMNINDGLHSPITAVARPLDGLRRLWFGSSPVKKNIDQCPRCRGTDKAREIYEGYGVAQFACDRCNTEWWS